MSNTNDIRLSIRELEVFVSVMATGSMTGAARQLDIGQPAVTRMVRDLEETIGFDLFQRNGPRISPTEKGLRFFEDARQLLASVGQVAQRAAGLRDDRVQSLSLVATPAMSAGLVPDLLGELKDVLPPALGIQTMDAEHVARALHAGAAHYGFCALPLAHADIDCLASARARLVAVVPADLPDEPLSLTRFQTHRMLTVGNTYRVRHAINTALEAAGVTPAAELTTNSSLNAIRSAAAGLGIALVDCVSALGIAIEGVRVVPLEIEIPYEWGIFRRSGTSVPELEGRLIDSFRVVSERLGAVRS
ncbi:LysR family transcriptional regulator [Salipiger abyssi]|nr:LysR family transcriptional regulator [Salipiger abyssi]